MQQHWGNSQTFCSKGHSLASLQGTTANHILTPGNMFSWSSKNTNGIHVFDTSGEDDVGLSNDKKLDFEHRYAQVKKHQGTRFNHCFKAAPVTALQMYRLSADNIFSTVYLDGRPKLTKKKKKSLHHNFQLSM